MTLARLWETVLGVPHRYENAARVSLAGEELSRAAKGLHTHLRGYAESDDPLVALMTDVFNQREMRRKNGE